MINGIFGLLILIVVITIGIYTIIQKKMFNFKIENRIITNFCNYSILVVVGICAIVYFRGFSNKVISAMQMYKNNKDLTQMWDFYNEKLSDENAYYTNFVKNGNVCSNYTKPYIPEGFRHIEGEWNTGFIISDDFENEFVWIPCTNEDKDGVVKIEKTDFVNSPITSHYTCFDEKYEVFFDSAIKNGGFYISRYEISYENGCYYSKNKKKIITNITDKEANEIVDFFNKNYDNRNYEIEMVNGYAYDMVLKWLLMDEDGIEKKECDIKDDSALISGKDLHKGIYDYLDNIMELTSEFCYDTQIVRGFPSSDYINEVSGNPFSKESRYVINKGDAYFSDFDLIAFRTLLIKR